MLLLLLFSPREMVRAPRAGVPGPFGLQFHRKLLVAFLCVS